MCDYYLISNLYYNLVYFFWQADFFGPPPLGGGVSGGDGASHLTH